MLDDSRQDNGFRLFDMPKPGLIFLGLFALQAILMGMMSSSSVPWLGHAYTYVQMLCFTAAVFVLAMPNKYLEDWKGMCILGLAVFTLIADFIFFIMPMLF
jgi:hypothetical protein